MSNRVSLSLAGAGIVAMSAGAASAGAIRGGGEPGPFVIAADIYLAKDGKTFGSSYVGPGSLNVVGALPTVRGESGGPTEDYRGVVLDGGFDAYDDAGVLITAAGSGPRGFDPSQIGVHRRVDALQNINVYRWVDTFTNISDTTAIFPVGHLTDLGSDGFDFEAERSAFRFISFENDSEDGKTPSDPVIAMMHGNNQWASENILFFRGSDQPRGFGFGPDDVVRGAILELEPGESVSLMFADFLAYSPAEEDTSGREIGSPSDVELAFDFSKQLLDDPSALFAGLSPEETSLIANWAIPSPGTVSLISMFAIGAVRRRR